MRTYTALIKEGKNISNINIKAYSVEDAKEVVKNRLTNDETLLRISLKN